MVEMVAFVETGSRIDFGTLLGLWLRSKLGTTLVLSCKRELEQTGIIVATIVVTELMMSRSRSRKLNYNWNWNRICPVPPPVALGLW